MKDSVEKNCVYCGLPTNSICVGNPICVFCIGSEEGYKYMADAICKKMYKKAIDKIIKLIESETEPQKGVLKL